ncbi:MAG TPA: hypothetical protein VGS97_18835, partial [Actinocrinis sp.]|uniref:hypothetical protein n=1 Tax=Actinocrinis sp. TaxID=1920516 RepID=UPI002DDCA1FB
LDDQLQAAADQVRRGIERLAAVGALHPTGPTAPTPWLASQLHAVRDAVLKGTVRVCPHLLSGPRIVLAAAWSPGTLVCPQCADQVRPDQREDNTCDRCRRHDQTIHPTLATAGHLILAYGLCGPCHRAEHAAPTARHHGTRRNPPRRPRNRRR